MDSRPGAGGANPVERLFDHVLDERQKTLFPRGARVLDVGAGEPERPCGAAFASPETASRLGPAEVGRRLRRWLPAGAVVLLAFPGARPLPALLERALRGSGDGPPLSAESRLTARELRAALGSGLEWRGTFALGVFLPGRARAPWAAAHPQAFGLLAAAEELVRGWPLLRAWGEITVLEGVRR